LRSPSGSPVLAQSGPNPGTQFGVRGHVRAWSAATCRRTQKSEIVGYVYLVGLKTLNCFDKGGRSVPREPRGRTPFVIFCYCNDAMSDRILVNVI
jgi:hypothetical protein